MSGFSTKPALDADAVDHSATPRALFRGDAAARLTVGLVTGKARQAAFRVYQVRVGRPIEFSAIAR